jgi:pimeloyl-ACP methyl ester carboxylesterase
MRTPSKTSMPADRVRIRRRRWFVTTVAVTMVAVGLGIGAWVEAATVAAERERFPAAGELVTVGDDTWHLRCDGPRSTAPTVVFEAGLGDSSATWSDLQASVTETRRACSYDRLGYGWSSAAHGERSPAVAATELSVLLDTAGERGPYVIVAHSLGALIARDFASANESEVAGLVLIDPTNETALAGSSAIAVVTTNLQSAASRFGLIRPFLLGELGAETGGLLPTGLEDRAGFLYRTESLNTSAAELAAVAANRVSTIDVPTIVILPSNALPRDIEHFAALGPDITFQTAKTTAHYLHYVEPALVLDAIDELAG